MPRWTIESRARQASLAKINRPWRHATGPKTVAGKNRSRQNARKHGLYSASFLNLRKLLYRHRLFLRDALLARSRNTEKLMQSNRCTLIFNHYGPIFIRRRPAAFHGSQTSGFHL